MSNSVLSLMRKTPHAWVKVYEDGKEKKVRYEISHAGTGFTVTAHHIAEEPNCKACISNLESKVPCTCTSVYMNERCMAKKGAWNPMSDEDVLNGFYKFATFDNGFSSFSHEEISAGYERFLEALKCTKEDMTYKKFRQLPPIEFYKFKFVCEDIVFVVIFDF